jgi:hypothetical protein
MNLFASLVYASCRVIAWGLAIILGFLGAVFVMTVMSVLWSISQLAGMTFLGFIMFLVWVLFYKD